MLTSPNLKPLIGIQYFDAGGHRKALNVIYKALSDGSLRLIWRADRFLIVTPDVVWATEQEQDLNVQSNVNWTLIY